MYSIEQSYKLQQWIDTLQEPTRFFVLMGLYILLPIMLFICIYIIKGKENNENGK